METFKKIEKCEYKDIYFNVELEYYYDDMLDEYYVDVELGNKNLKKIRNEYRKIKNLLTDDNIKEIRNQYKLSQRDFAVALGLGEVTITRYETKTVQDKSNDILIRQSKSPHMFMYYLESNSGKYIEVNGIEKYNELLSFVKNLTNDIDFLMNQYNEEERGKNAFSIEKLKKVIFKIKNKRSRLSKTILAKLLWYIDNLSYQLNGKSMTGLVYISMPYGAYPKMYDEILNDKDIEIQVYWNNDYEYHLIENVNVNDDLNIEEERIIDFVVNKFKTFNASEIVKYMHDELAYKETEKFKIIPYSYSSNIKMFNEYIK